MMKPTSKIYTGLAVWVFATAAMFLFVFPYFAKGLTNLQQSHQDQTDQYNKLRAQAASLQKMKSDLDVIKSQAVQPSDFFSNDLQLVSEIKQIETNAQSSNVKTTLTIPVSADKAQPLKGSTSGLYVVPFSLKVEGDFPNLLSFLKAHENSFFIAPVNGLNMIAEVTDSGQKSINTQLLGSFFIKKTAADAAVEADKAASQ